MIFHTLASGSSGNSYCIELEDELVFVDMGVTLLSVRSLLKTVASHKKISLLITHEHTDHIKGLVPFVKHFQPRIYTSEGTAEAISNNISPELIYPLAHGNAHYINGFGITPFLVSHDAAEPFGYIVMTPHCNVGIVTDTGCVTDVQLDYLKHADFLVLEANHDSEMLMKGSYPHYLKKRIAGAKGHLSNSEALSVITSLQDTSIKHCLFAHVSEENNDYAMLERLAVFCRENYGVNTDVLRQKTCAGYSVQY
jgi:phosphoribosyl 1,2-cyclic phosphodiesterase